MWKNNALFPENLRELVRYLLGVTGCVQSVKLQPEINCGLVNHYLLFKRLSQVTRAQIYMKLHWLQNEVAKSLFETVWQSFEMLKIGQTRQWA